MFSPPPNKLVLGFILILTCCAASAFSQSQVTGRLAGTITDEKGAVINSAQVVAVNQTTNDERTVITDATGNYYVSFLLPGAYHVTIKATGFNSAVFDSVPVVITETTRINVKLTVADIKVDPINVRTESLSQSDGPQLGRVVNSRAVSEFLTAYTYGQSIDNASGTNGGSADAVRDTGMILGNQLDNRANRGLSDFDRTHRLVVSFCGTCPSLRSRRNQGWADCYLRIGRSLESSRQCSDCRLTSRMAEQVRFMD